MNIHQIETFIKTADAGSFSKSGEQEYISANSVIKQINAIERELNISLFKRTRHGVSLTNEGKVFYEDAVVLLQQYRAAVLRVQNVANDVKNTIRVGTSTLMPPQILTELWPEISKLCPDLKIKLTPIEINPEKTMEFLKNMEKYSDVIFSTLGNADMFPCHTEKLYDETLCIAVPVTHPLASRGDVSFEDLNGETILFLKKGRYKQIDKTRDIMENRFPGITIKEVPFYEENIFNQCAISGELFWAANSWTGINPLVKIIPISSTIKIQFGIIYPKNPSKQIKAFVNAATLVCTRKKH